MATRFSGYTDDQLAMLFSTSEWNSESMTGSARLDALQERENRAAKEEGTVPRTVMTEDMEGNQAGYMSGSVIMINESLLNDGVYHAEVPDGNGGKVTQIQGAVAPNWECLEALGHEHHHGTLLDEGRNQTAASYITPATDYDIYRISPEEREAFEAGQKMALDTLARVNALTNKQDVNQQDYIDLINENSYEASLEKAKEHFGDPNIQQAVDNVVRDREEGRVVDYQTPGEQSVAQLIDLQNAQEVTQGTTQGEAQGYEGQEVIGMDEHQDSEYGQDLTGWEADLAEAEAMDYEEGMDDGYDYDDGMEM